MSPWYEVENRKLYYEIKGTGRPVVLIHGYLGDSKAHFGKQFNEESIVKNYQLIAPDLRGFGQSQLEPFLRWGEKHTKDQLLIDIRALIEHLNVDSPIIGGYSVGSALAIEYAKVYPASGLILISPRPFARETGKSYPYLSKERRSSSNFIFSFSANLLWGILKRYQKRSSKKWIENKAKNKELIKEFDKVKDIPTILIYAKGDTVTPKIAFDILKNNLPNMIIAEFEGDHGILHEKPDEFNRVLKEFLDKINSQ